MSKPIRPNEAVKKRIESIPSEVVDAFNELIAQNYSSLGGARAVFYILTFIYIIVY